MLPDDVAGRVDQFARGVGLSSIAADETGIVVIGDKADFLAVGLVGDSQSRPAGDVANLVLVVTAHRKQHVFEQIAIEAKQHV